MDWGRAKSILIAAFLALDIYLGYQLWLRHAERVSSYDAATGGESAEVRERLASVGIVLLNPLPSTVPEMRVLRVRVQSPDPAAVASAFFAGSPDVQASPWASGQTLRRGGEWLTVLPEGLVLYERKDLAGGWVGQSMDADMARREAEKFLASHGGMPEDGGIDTVLPAGGDGRPIYQVVFVQKYHNWPLFDGYVALEVVAGGVRTMQKVWLEPAGFAGPRRQVITPVQALESLAAELGRARAPGEKAENVLVERVDLGYYGGLGKEQAAQLQAVPVWRVLTRGGDQFYVNAYNGVLEKRG